MKCCLCQKCGGSTCFTSLAGAHGVIGRHGFGSICYIIRGSGGTAHFLNDKILMNVISNKFINN